MTHNSKLWQLRAGIITEGEYQDSMEEAPYTPVPFGDPHGKNPNTKMFTPDGEVGVDKPATSAAALGTDLIKKGQDVRKTSAGIESGEASNIDNITSLLLQAARDKRTAFVLPTIAKFIKTKLDSIK